MDHDVSPAPATDSISLGHWISVLGRSGHFSLIDAIIDARLEGEDTDEVSLARRSGSSLLETRQRLAALVQAGVLTVSEPTIDASHDLALDPVAAIKSFALRLEAARGCDRPDATIPPVPTHRPLTSALSMANPVVRAACGLTPLPERGPMP